MNDDLDVLYRNRFKSGAKDGIWIEIVNYFNKMQGRVSYNDGIVVDVAAGYCEFINNIESDGKRVAYDLNPDVGVYVDKNIDVIVDSVNNLKSHFDSESVSLFFQSNFLEHIPKDQIEKLLEDEYVLLKSGGQVWILTPNIKYVGGKYWEFWDHITPLTEDALIELAELKKFKVKKVIRKFLPYTTKSLLPQNRWIVRLYLRLMPISGILFGKQSFIVLEKE